MIKKLKKFFYTTYLGELYFRFLLWQDHRRFVKKIKYLSHNGQQILLNRTTEMYRQGITKIKNKVNNLVAIKSAEEYDKALKGIEDLVGLATNEGDKWSDSLDIIYNSYVRKGADIKNDTDMAKMVEERIQHRQEFWKFQEQKELHRKIRKAKQDKDIQLAKKLEEEFQEKYGRSKRLRGT